ncbi:hypothetical protein IPJ63_02340 [Candidatus Nomurabacteria bacterium]|nr:MAG: hypothetical protein IPJ63_02340 [Candidatus Nomurabacteria bacterium]
MTIEQLAQRTAIDISVINEIDETPIDDPCGIQMTFISRLATELNVFTHDIFLKAVLMSEELTELRRQEFSKVWVLLDFLLKTRT